MIPLVGLNVSTVSRIIHYLSHSGLCFGNPHLNIYGTLLHFCNNKKLYNIPFSPVSDDSTLTWKHQKIPEDAFSVQPTSLRKRCHSYF